MQAAEGISPLSLHLLLVAVPLFWELQQLYQEKCKCVPLRARKLSWGKKPTNSLSAQTGSLSYVASIALFELR